MSCQHLWTCPPSSDLSSRIDIHWSFFVAVCCQSSFPPQLASWRCGGEAGKLPGKPSSFPCSGERETFLFEYKFQCDVDYYYWLNALRTPGFCGLIPLRHCECAACKVLETLELLLLVLSHAASMEGTWNLSHYFCWLLIARVFVYKLFFKLAFLTLSSQTMNLVELFSCYFHPNWQLFIH